MSIKTLMAIQMEIQMLQKITYIEVETSPRWAAGYKIIYEFKNIREKLPVLFLRHVMQQAINLEGEHGPDIGYSDYKIRRSQYWLDVKFMKYSGLHPIAAGHEDDRYEEVVRRRGGTGGRGGVFLNENDKNTGCKK